MRSAGLLLLIVTLALGACSGSRKDAGAGTAEGEILPGSASDAMLPYDTVRSQPPLAPSAVGNASGEPADGESEAAQGQSDAGGPAAEEPEKAEP